ncbi:baseplate J/gp47 family protein [Rhizosaccharibacter radicis]|uniref:Baseplate J/gp47 family protein n=1 Tax=Rhizosaccharibacter radicis TaxID=2782605 RepID=A0ABT1VVY4_9PROT|nr:baseplate J/gp47 family protein [Acetobacteraceae bacterium KSS12]
MPFARPTLTQLRQQAQQDVQDAGITGIDAFLRFGVLSVLCWVQAQLAYLHYGYLDWIAKQAVPWTATDEFLAGWGQLKGVSRKPATAAATTAVSFAITGPGSPVIPSGTQIARSDGVLFVTTADSSASNGNAVAPAVASATGAAGNTAAGASLALQSPVAGVQASGIFAAAATGGADVEDEDGYRARIIGAYQASGSTGREAEYIDWALVVPGITRAWVNRNGFGGGTVVIYVMLDEANASTGGFPVGGDGAAASETRYQVASGDQLTVANAIYPDQAVTALVIVCAPIAQPIAFQITDLGTANTTANQAAITAALQDMFLRVSGPGVTIHPNEWEAALVSLGLPQFQVVSPFGPILPQGVGSMPVLGAISFAS